MKYLLPIAAAALTSLSATFAHASTLTFDFANKGSNHSLLTVAADEDTSVTVDVTGRYYTIDNGMFDAGYAIDVDTNSYGLISKNWRGEAHTIDSYGYGNEAMIFSFDPSVRITGIDISWSYGTGAYDVFVDEVFTGNTILDGAQVPTVYGNTFAIGARGIEQDGRCSYWTTVRHGHYTYRVKKYRDCTYTADTGLKIRGITIEVAPVPVPASALLLLGALGGFGAMRRRRG